MEAKEHGAFLAPTSLGDAAAMPAPPGVTSEPAASAVVVVVGKKRGRPRKYLADGSLAKPFDAASPRPVKHTGAAMKKSRGKPVDFQYGLPPYSIGDSEACSAGANFTPHIINVAPGEDITMKVISFSQRGLRSICILSGNGAISNVTLRQPDSSGGTLTYEGRFELLSLSGSFTPSDNGSTRSRSGGMSVSLASPDGRVIGGGVAGLLVAASPVQIVVGSFLPINNEAEQRIMKTKESAASIPVLSAPVPISSMKMHNGQAQHDAADPEENAANPFLRMENWTHSSPELRNLNS